MSRFRWSTLLIVSSFAALSACDQVPLTSPTGSTISLSANASVVPVNGSVEVTATVTESAGTAVQNGTTVSFVSNFGKMEPPEAETHNGRAVSRFVASGQSGTAKINAFSGGASTKGGSTTGTPPVTTPGGELTLLVGGAAAGRLVMRVEPATIPQSGGTVTFIATVSDFNGNVLAGAPVVFSIATGTTGGLLGSGTLSVTSAVSDANGNAQTSLTTSVTTTVTATIATTLTAQVTASATVTVVTAPTITIDTCSATPSVGVAVSCTVKPVTVAATGSPIQNVTVNWGDGTGEQPLGPVSSPTITSHTYGAPGTYTVTATAIDQNGQRATGSIALVVQRVLPTITLDVPTTGTAGTPVAMSITPGASSSTTQPIASVTVEFGDGTSRTFGAITGKTGFTKTYGAEGGYTVTATVTDASGQRGSSSAAIVIARAVVAPSPTVTLVHNTAPAKAGQVESFTVTAAAGTGGAPVTNVRVTLQDGTVIYNASTSGSFTWTPASSGTAVLTSVVTDAAGNQGNHILVLIVDP